MDTGYGGGDFTYTGYNAQGGANGGGFVHGGTQESPSSKKTGQDASIRPVTIKQLLDAVPFKTEHSEFKIDDVELAWVTVVAQLQNTKQTSINTLYKLDDGTGSIEGRRFIPEDLRHAIEAENKPEIPYNAYVRVYGKLRELDNLRWLSVDHVHPLQDMNEISYHALEATLVHVKAKGGPTVAEGAGDMGGYGGQMDTGMYGESDGVGEKLRMCNEDAKRFYKYLSTNSRDMEGLNVTEIARGLKMDLNRCTECSRQLCDVGLIYSTLDEETWAIVET